MLPIRPHPVQQLDADVGRSLARLSGLEGLGRSIMVGVMPLVAFETLGSKAAVSYAYFAGACLALLATLNVGAMESIVPRRWVVTGALGAMMVGAVLFMGVRNGALAIGIGLVATEAAIFSVCMSLYIMEYIDKRDLLRNESRRMIHNGVAWMIGPIAGVWILRHVADWVPFALSFAIALGTLAFFWVLRLGPHPALRTPRAPAPSALRNVPRYFRQRYLRIAYAITVTRGTFWAAFFIYVPIYVVESGIASFWTGIMFTTVAAMLLFSPVVARSTERHSTRVVVIAAFCVIGSGMTLLALLGESRTVGLPVWLFAATGAVTLDVLGNLPFMRTVKPRERLPMTTVFSSWREVSSLLAPGLAAVVLLVAPFWAYYAVIAVLCFVTAAFASFLPRRL